MLMQVPVGSSYLTFTDADISERKFLGELLRRTGCCLLLDVNNIYVRAINQGFPARAYLQGIPADRARQVHLTGNSQEREGLLVDTARLVV